VLELLKLTETDRDSKKGMFKHVWLVTSFIGVLTSQVAYVPSNIKLLCIEILIYIYTHIYIDAM
jgi:hypothetical protein